MTNTKIIDSNNITTDITVDNGTTLYYGTSLDYGTALDQASLLNERIENLELENKKINEILKKIAPEYFI